MAHAFRSRWPVTLLLLGGCVPHSSSAPVPVAPRSLLGVVDTIIALPNGRPFGVASSGQIAYITIYDTLLSGQQALSIWDFGRRTYRHAAIRTGAVPTNVAFLPNGTSAFVASQKSFRVDRIDVRRGRLDAHWHTPANDPFQVATSPDGRTVYATGNAGWLYAYDVRTGDPRGAAAVSKDPNGAVVSPDGHYVYLTHLGAPDIGRVDVRTWSYQVLAEMDSAQGQGMVSHATAERSTR
jgi:DNA-binding beta-propeller fold protein YncE